MSSAQLYDSIGATYAVTRRTEPRRLKQGGGEAEPRYLVAAVDSGRSARVARRCSLRVAR